MFFFTEKTLNNLLFLLVITMSERITINRLRNTLKAVQKLTQNSDLTIQHWNGKFFLYENGRQISDQYNSKKEIWNYLRGYLQIKPIERGVKK